MESPFPTEDFGESFSHDGLSYDFIFKFYHCRITYKCNIIHLLFPNTVTRNLLKIQASCCGITKLRAHITLKCKKMNIRKCWVFEDQIT